MKKLTEDLKRKHISSQKGKVYLYLIEANRIAFENGYNGLAFDIGVKTIESFINGKIDSIFDEKTGAFWSKDYKGFDEVYQKAKAAQQDIVNDEYSDNVVEFIKAAIKSYLPKIDESRLRGQYSVIPVPKTEEDDKITYLEQGITGKKKELEEEKQAIEKQKIRELSKGLGSSAASLLDGEEEEEEIEEIEELNENEVKEISKDLGSKAQSLLD